MPTKGITSPEGMLMLCVAGLLDIMGFMIFIGGIWFGLDDYGILEIIGIAIIGLWMFMRYGPMAGSAYENVKKDRDTMKKNWEEPMAGSGNIEDWKKNDKGVWELNKKDAGNNKTKRGREIKKWMSPQEIAKDEAKKLAIKGLKRFGLNFLVELIPFLGGFWPGWTIIVWKEMKE